MRRLAVIVFLCLLSTILMTAHKSLFENYSQWGETSSLDLLSKGRVYTQQSRMDSALLCYTIIANRYNRNSSDKEKRIIAQALNNAGYLYFFHYHDYAHSYASLLQSLEISEEMHLDDNLPYVYLNLGNMYLTYADQYHSQKLYQRSENLYKKGVSSAISIRDWDVLLTLFVNLCNIEISHGSLDSIHSEISAFDSLEIPENVPNLRYSRLLSSAVKRLQMKDYSGARQLFLQQIDENDAPLTPERYEYQALSNVISTLESEQSYAEAITYAMRMDTLARRHHMSDIESEACERLAVLCDKSGRTAEANKYRYQYFQKKDSLMTVDGINEISEIHFLHELQKVEHQVRDLQTKRRVQNIILFAVIMVAVIVVVFLVIVNRKNRLLRERTMQLYQHTRQLLRAEEEKRRLLQQEKEQQDKEQRPQAETETHQQKYINSTLTDDEKQEIASAIDEELTLGSEIYNISFSLDNLATLIGYNTKYVSQVINEYYGCNFATLIGNQRVKEACKRMLDSENYGQYTLEGISQSVGFKSRNTFAVAFKRVTGLTPSEYLRMSHN